MIVYVINEACWGMFLCFTIILISRFWNYIEFMQRFILFWTNSKNKIDSVFCWEWNRWIFLFTFLVSIFSKISENVVIIKKNVIVKYKLDLQQKKLFARKKKQKEKKESFLKIRHW